ncbi:MAG TPA: hydroxyacid dehydrogenase [Caldisericia bacterium]|nr:hydroxyacid dehydrogenase [Caldisericia bacterium]
MAKILISDPIAKAGVDLLQKEGHEVVVKKMTPEELVSSIGDYDAIIVRSATKVTADVIKAGSKLRIIGRAGVGLDNVDSNAAKEKGIKVVNTPAATSISVAELAIGHMLAASRWIGYGTATMKEGKWEKKAMEGVELYGKTLGLIGVGRIGRETAKRAMAFGMEVIAFDPYVSDPGMQGIHMVSKDELLAKADFISLHIPLTPETKNILDKQDFDKCKKGLVLVNCARGGTVNEEALYNALKEGKLFAAGIDVFEKEPPEGVNKLASLPNVALTPHIGAATEEGQTRAGVQLAEKIAEFFKEGK